MQARRHFYGGGAVALARKDAARRAWRAHGAPLSDVAAANLLAELRTDPVPLPASVVVVHA